VGLSVSYTYSLSYSPPLIGYPYPKNLNDRLTECDKMAKL